jgi:hypothetical protein
MDEAQYHHDGITNTRNSYSWSHNNSHEVEQCKFQQSFSVSVWCGIASYHLCGPHIIKGHLTAASYRHFMENEVWFQFENVPLQTRQ